MTPTHHTYSRPVVYDDVLRMGKNRIKVTPSNEERGQIAKFLNVLAITELRAEFDLAAGGPDKVVVNGRLAAEIQQTCVVTLAPVRERIDSSFRRVYLRDDPEAKDKADSDAEGDALEWDPLADETTDWAEHGIIDLGKIVTEVVALEMAPYPRADGAELADAGGNAGQDDEDVTDHPFAALAQLQKGDAPKGG